MVALLATSRDFHVSPNGPTLVTEQFTETSGGTFRATREYSTGSTSNYYIWRTWDNTYDSGTTSNVIDFNTFVGTVYTQAAWRGWNHRFDETTGTLHITMNGTTDTNRVWHIWNCEGAWSTEAPVPETAEERAAREQREARRRAEQEVLAKQSALIKKRAQDLLLSCLDDTQKRDWVREGMFYLYVEDRKYRIKKGRSGNVELVDAQNHTLERYCCHPVPHVPDEDTVLTQMMMLRHAEKEFIGKANVPWRREGFRRAA